jgi:hypothetical protein
MNAGALPETDEALWLLRRRRRAAPGAEAIDELPLELARYIYRQNYLDWQERLKADGEKQWRFDMAMLPAPGVEDGPAGLARCTTGIKLLTRGCNHNQAIVLRCRKHTCPHCSQIRSSEDRARWLPVLASMKHPKQIVLAVKSLSVAIPSLDLLAKCFRRFCELRLGKRSRAKYKKLSLEFIEEHRAEFDANHNQDQKRFSADRWIRSIERFWNVDVPALERKRRQDVLASKDPKQSKSEAAQALKVRHMLFGFRALEVTGNVFSGWHPHYHSATDGGFLPFPALMVLWMAACTVGGECFAAFADPDEPMPDGQVLGRTAHISAITKPAELLKYVTKHQHYDDPGAAAGVALPPLMQQELDEALHGRKHIWPLGKAKPAELPKHPCPGCSDPECTCHMGENLHTYCGNDVWQSEDGQRLFQVERFEAGGLTWHGLSSPLFNSLEDCATVPMALTFPIPARDGPAP